MDKKLPVLATFAAALALCRAHLGYAFLIITPWLVIFLTAFFLLQGDIGADAAVSGAAAFEPWALFLIFLYFVGWGSIAVLWHWRVLRNDGRSRQIVTFDQRVWSYLLRGLLIAIIGGGVGLLTMVPFGIALTSFGDFIGPAGFFVAVACVIIVTSYILARLSVALPGIALGVHEFGLSRSWNATTDNGFRLLLVTALPLIPISLFSWGLELIAIAGTDLGASSVVAILPQVIFQLLDFAFGLFSLTVLSLTYAFFAENKEARGVLGFS